MASAFKKAMLYLGLGPDEEYDDHEIRLTDGDDVVVEPDEPARAPSAVRAVREPAMAAAEPPVRRASTVRAIPADQEPTSTIRPTPAPVAARPSGGGGGVVRTLPAPVTTKPTVVMPSSFNDAQTVADRFKNRQPVIMNLQDADRDLSRRLIDFTSGLCYGIGGQMERVADKVYLLTPVDVEVSAEERRRLRDDIDDS